MTSGLCNSEGPDAMVKMKSISTDPGVAIKVAEFVRSHGRQGRGRWKRLWV